MAYRKASQTSASLVLVGGRDCKPFLLPRAQGPDLWVKGGAIVDKRLCAKNDLLVNGNAIVEKTLSVIGDLNIVGDVEVLGKLTAPDVCVTHDLLVLGNIVGDTITANIGTINDKLTATDICVTHDLLVLGNIVGDTITANLATINDKLTATDICVTHDLLVLGNIVGDTITANICTINDKLTATDVCVTDDLMVTGTSTLSGGLSVTGGATVAGGIMVMGASKITGHTTIMGKLTVTGVIDPTALILSGQAIKPMSVTGNDGAIWVTGNSPNYLVYTNDMDMDAALFLADGSLPMTGPLIQLDNTDCTTLNTGCLQLAGGMSVVGNVHCGAHINVEAGFFVNDVKVIGDQELAIADVLPLGSQSLLNQTGSAPVSTISGIGGALSTIDILGIPVVVTSDLQTRIDNANENLSSLTTQINNLVDDVGNVRAQLNILLQALRNHGLIDT